MRDPIMTNQTRRITEAHITATQLALTDIVSSLKDRLGPKLLALTVGTTTRSIDRWVKEQTGPTNLQEQQRLRTAYQVFEMLKGDDADATIRAWFMGMNPQLDDTSPAEALANDQFREVLAAARAFLAGG